ncbi:MAG: succinate dehydrogenase, hydrophobic membrane anchor protein [Alphaproteobacteria bacterium]|nr:succinate dehydrogenase, hydrophobic membrane anchor protein [Alphaproteobacteria bacterium]
MAKRPTSTFAAQRASAVLLIPLALWFLWSIAAHAGDDLAGAQAWLGHLHNKLLFGAFVAVGAFHGRIGLHEIIEDYIHGPLNATLNALAIAAAAAITLLTWASLFQI